MLEWKVDSVDERFVEDKLNALTATGYTVEKIVTPMGDTSRWTIVSTKQTTPAPQRLDDVIDDLVEQTDPQDFVGGTE